MGVATKSFASSAGDGVATGSPVAVRITPFIADGGARFDGKLGVAFIAAGRGVSKTGSFAG